VDALRVGLGLGIGFWLGGCAKPVVSDLDAYPVVAMNRAEPYPSDEVLAKRVFEVAVVDRPSPGLEEEALRKVRSQVRVGLEKIAASHGAAVIERSQPGFEGVRVDSPDAGFEGVEAETIRSGDYAISTRFTTYSHQAVWNKPIKWPGQSEEDLAKKPGTCIHTASVAFDVLVLDKGWEDRVERTYVLTHSAKQENKDLDKSCTIAPVSVDALFETAIAEALECLDLPLGTRVSPRGHVLAHRKSKDGETHIYQISLGADQGVDAKEPVEFRRIDVIPGSGGAESRSERVIGKGVATDQITAQDTWVAADPADFDTELLEGDVVRRVFSQGLINDLKGPGCKRILSER